MAVDNKLASHFKASASLVNYCQQLSVPNKLLTGTRNVFTVASAVN